MKRYLPFLVGGAACLPFTYEISRNGTVLLSGVIVAFIGLAAYFCSRYLGEVKLIAASLAFIFGAVCSSISFYLQWYKVYGHKDGDLDLSLATWVLECGLISTIGILTITASSFLANKHIARN